ncbi:Maf family protein [Aquibacillus koreensis]|uniref:dTTP/UTP pyrophosphatase n=1 Tax=Aquibacillus koreensis TaxID=279446 RepID=A0A9X3WG14_9BACI|nr:Maf family protein [Aquibacillus koreensis]MCT2537952.1 Maf family protein [Aquibacillus koreensis]MDC3419157.1 Maf family protein [Aquibacillus koreensis]
MNQLILASGSPRRKELLEQVGIPCIVRKSDFDESTVTESDPKKLVETLAVEKGNTIDLQADQIVLAADTVVSYKQKVLTKPENEADALAMLKDLNGNQHHVYTGVMIRSTTKQVVFSTCTTVQFLQLTEDELNKYIASGEPFDKAGGYGIQGKGAFLVKEIKGDYYSVVGLPISAVVQLLKEFGVYPVFN